MTDTNSVAKAAALLLEGWRDPSRLIPSLPDDIRPRDAAEAYAIQAEVSHALGRVGGWKVGAPGPEGAPNCAPMPLAGIHAGPAHLPAARWPMRVVEAEICFIMGTDLPIEDGPWTREQVVAAIGSVHPGIELLQSRFVNADAVDPMTNLSDGLGHGCYVYGHEIPAWRDIDFTKERVRVLFSGEEALARTGNSAGDMLRLIHWLANEGTRWAGGLRVGQVVTTGSWTGKSVVPPGKNARAVFEHAGEATLDFI